MNYKMQLRGQMCSTVNQNRHNLVEDKLMPNKMKFTVIL